MTDSQAVPTDLDQLAPPVAEVVRGAQVILVSVEDGSDPALDGARRTAIALAALVDAKLVLLDRSDTTYADTPRIFELTRDEVVGLGERQYLLDAMDEAISADVSVTAFQHSLPGVEAISDAAERVRADIYVVPDHLDGPGLVDRLKGRHLSERAATAAPDGTAVLEVDDEGSLVVLKSR